MKKLYLEFISKRYPKKEVYDLAYHLGERLTNFLGEDIFILLLDSKILLTSQISKIGYEGDKTFKLHSASKALEGFLLKIIKGKKLKQDINDKIGEVFGKKDNITKQKIKDKKLIARTKTAWDFCRNDIMHFSVNKRSTSLDMYNNHREIIDIMKLLYTDFYGKTNPSEEVRNYISKKIKVKGYKS